jgi:hypothetical protein
VQAVCTPAKQGRRTKKPPKGRVVLVLALMLEFHHRQADRVR